jgi:hypothetical protein
MLSTLAAILLCLAPQAPLPARVDEVEINHVYDCQGRLTFVQAILWDHYGDRREVVAWRIIQTAKDRPIPASGEWSIPWPSEAGSPSHVRAQWLSRSWTQYDPEMQDRRRVPVDARRGVR